LNVARVGPASREMGAASQGCCRARPGLLLEGVALAVAYVGVLGLYALVLL